MFNTKFFMCPMSKNIVDTIIEFNSPLIGLLPSRRQIEYNGGYVNNWDTDSFVRYVRDKSNIIIERDHAGIGQNTTDEYYSYKVDSKNFDIIHIDPWKHHRILEDGINETIENIKFLHKLNPSLKYEIGTEESIRHFNEDDLRQMLENLSEKLSSEEFNNILYVVIQSGVRIDLVEKKNVGNFEVDRLKSMIKICKDFNKKTKEHNGDYLSNNEIKIRFDEGLDSINIGPEIVQIETETILKFMNENETNQFYDICLSSGAWKKWVTSEFNIPDKKTIISVCGHYNFQKLNEMFNINEDIEKEIKKNLRIKLRSLLDIV